MNVRNHYSRNAISKIFQCGKRFQNRNHYSVSSSSQQIKPYESIPGLKKLPIIGGLHHFLPIIGTIGAPENFVLMMEKMYKNFGPIVKLDGVFPRANMVILYEPEHFDQVFRAEDVTPSRPGFDTLVYYRTEYRKERYDGIYGLTTAQSAQWRDFRTKVNPALLKPKLIKLYAHGLDEIAREMVERLKKLQTDPKYLQWNFDVEITKLSLESVALVALGSRLGALKDNLAEDHPSRILMKSAKDIMDLAMKLDFIPRIWKIYPIPAFKTLMDTLDEQWNISEMYITEAKKRIKDRDHDIPEEDKSVIEKLLVIDEKVAIMMANEMMLAGIDTVAFSITALLYHLAVNPKVQDKLRHEIRSGDKNRRYLKACLKEALRLNPVITGNLRRTTKEHVVGGYQIPTDIDVIAPNEYLSKLEKHYPRPLEFIPDRWLVDKTDPLYYGNAHPMITQPFGFGVRSCIGRRIAELEIEIFVHRLIDDMNVTWEGPPIKILTRVVNTFKKPYYFKFEPAK